MDIPAGSDLTLKLSLREGDSLQPEEGGWQQAKGSGNVGWGVSD